MNRFDIKGSKIIYGSRKALVLTITDEQEPLTVLLRYENEELGEIPYDEFLQLHSNGVIRIVKPCNKVVNDLNITPSQMKEMVWREAYILAMLRHKNCHNPDVRKHIITSVYATRKDTKRPGESTVSRWVKTYINHECDIRRQVLGKAGRGSGIMPELEALMDKFIRKYYLSRESYHKRGTYQKFEKFCKKVGYMRIPSEKTFGRRIDKLCPKKVIEARKGWSEARKEFRCVLNKRDNVTFMEEYQIDTANFNLGIKERVGDKFYFLGCVSINFCFEPYSGSVPGYSIQIGNSGEQSGFIVNTITHALSVKNDPNYIQSGIPLKILMDAGPGYIAKSTRDFLNVVGCDYDVTPVRSPWLKGAVERFIKHVRDTFFRGIKGYLGKYNPDEYTDISVKKAAHLTVEQFSSMFANFIKEYHNTPLERLNGLTPNEAWRKGLATYRPMHIEDIAELRQYKGELVRSRVLNKNQGVHHQGHWFNSPELQRLYLRMHQSRKFKEYKVDFLVDPLNADDVSIIVPSVISGDPLNMELVSAFNTRTVNGKSFAQLRASRAGVKCSDDAMVYVSDQSEWTEYRAPRKTGSLINIYAEQVSPEQAEAELDNMVGKSTHTEPKLRGNETISNANLKNRNSSNVSEVFNEVTKVTNAPGVEKLW